MQKLIDVQKAKEFASTFLADPILKMAVNAVLDNAPAAKDIDVPGKWIPVTEPPKKRGCYLVTVNHWLDGKPVTREAYWNGVDWLSCEKKQELTPRVTHWMPLPEPPKAGK